MVVHIVIRYATLGRPGGGGTDPINPAGAAPGQEKPTRPGASAGQTPYVVPPRTANLTRERVFLQADMFIADNRVLTSVSCVRRAVRHG